MFLTRIGTGSHGAAAAQAIDLDGTNDYLSRASDLTGNADGKTFTFSAWVWLNNVAASQTIYQSNSARFELSINTSGQILIKAYNAALGLVINATVTTVLPVATLSHILISCDVANAASRSIYINDVAASVTWSTYANDTIDFAGGIPYIGFGGSQKLFGRLAHVYLDYTYRDLSNSTNRRLFITADRKPAANQAALNPILYLKCDDPATCHVNSGTGGNMVLNGTIARSGRGPNQFNAAYSKLNGTSQYLSRTTTPTGIADSKTFTFSCVFSTDSATAPQYIAEFGSSTSSRFSVTLSAAATGQIAILGTKSDGTTVLFAQVTLPTLTAGRNYILTASFDMSDTTKRHVYVNGVAATVAWNTYVNDFINFGISTTPRYRVGLDVTGAYYVNGRVGEVFFHTSYINLSIASNLAKFVTGTGIDAKPADLGANGELPLGTSPLIYLPMYGNDAGNNRGTSGAFTVNSGPFTGARGPNEFWGNKADFDGTTGYFARTSALTGVSDSGVFAVSFVLELDTATNFDLWSIAPDTSAINAKFRFAVDGLGKFSIIGKNSANTTVFQAAGATSLVSGTKYHFHVCIDLSNTTKRFVYINGVQETMTWNTYANNAINFSAARMTIGCGNSLVSFVNGRLSEFFFTTEYIDFSQEANRLKFRDAFGNPVDLGPQGKNPTGTQPAIYLRFDPSNNGANAGYSGAFTVNGTITDGGQL